MPGPKDDNVGTYPWDDYPESGNEYPWRRDPGDPQDGDGQVKTHSKNAARAAAMLAMGAGGYGIAIPRLDLQPILYFKPEDLPGSNLLPFSQDFGNIGGWTVQGGVTLESVGHDDPVGGKTAALYSTNATSGKIRSIGGWVPNPDGTYTLSIYVKAGPNHTGGSSVLQIWDGVSFFTGTPFVATGSWVRYDYTSPIGAAPTNLRAYIQVNGTTADGDIYVALAQMEYGSAVTQYNATGGKANGVITQWVETVAGNDGQQVDTANAPIVLPDAIDGFPAAAFQAGSEELLLLNTVNTTGPFTLYFVLAQSASTANILGSSGSRYYGRFAANRMYSRPTGGAGTIISADGVTTPYDTFALYRIERAADNTYRTWKNGLDISAAPIPSEVLDAHEATKVFSSTAAPNEYQGVELALFDDIQTPDDVALTYNHFNTRYPSMGITLP